MHRGIVAAGLAIALGTAAPALAAGGDMTARNLQPRGWLVLIDGQTTVTVTNPAPAPSGLALIGVGLVAGAIARRRRRSDESSR